MDEIIKSTDNRYSEYETLLFLRDKLRKEAYAWKNRYLAEFGNLITACLLYTSPSPRDS